MADPCPECDGEGFKFTQKDGEVFMGPCPTCVNESADKPVDAKGLWLEVKWDPNETSPPGSVPWKVRLIDETNGIITVNQLTRSQMRQIVGTGKTGLQWLSIIALASEHARLRQETEELRRRVVELERRRGVLDSIVWFLGRIFGRTGP